jgi:hypothetical protein
VIRLGLVLGVADRLSGGVGEWLRRPSPVRLRMFPGGLHGGVGTTDVGGRSRAPGLAMGARGGVILTVPLFDLYGESQLNYTGAHMIMQNCSTVHGHLGPLGLEREHAGALRLVLLVWSARSCSCHLRTFCEMYNVDGGTRSFSSNRIYSCNGTI